MFNHSEAYTYGQAVELVKTQIMAKYVSFPIDTQFGSIFVEVKNSQPDEMYRYWTTPWATAPINDATKRIIRNTSYEHYVSIAPIKGSIHILGLTVMMAMAECLVRHVTGTDTMVDRETTNYIAGTYMLNYYEAGHRSPSYLASEYLKTVKPAGIFGNRGSDRTTRMFLTEFFKNIMEDCVKTSRKDDANFGEKTHEVRLSLGYNAFNNAVFKHLFREMRIKTVKPDSEIAKRHRKVMAPDSGYYNAVEAMVAILRGDDN